MRRRTEPARPRARPYLEFLYSSSAKSRSLLILNDLLLTRLRSVSTNDDSPDGTPNSCFIFDLPSAATSSYSTGDHLFYVLMHRLQLATILKSKAKTNVITGALIIELDNRHD